ncbi:MAG: hypothetical protein QXJ64_04325 [Thermosphaera sp.]
MVAFPERREKERREGHPAGQNPQRDPKGSGRTDLRVPWRTSRSPVSARGSFILGSSPTDGVHPWSFGSSLGPLCCGSEHPRHLPIFRGDLRRILLAPEHLSSHPSLGRGGPGLAGTAPERGVLRRVPGRDISFHPQREDGQGAGVHRPGYQAGWTPGDPGLLCFRRKEKAPGTGRRSSRISGVGVCGRCGSL